MSQREAEIHNRLLPLSGGSERDIRVKGWANLFGNFTWAADGKGICLNSQTHKAISLVYVDLKGNTRLLQQEKGITVPAFAGRPLARHL